MDAGSSAHRSAALRLGGAMLLLGAVAWLVVSGLHGELPAMGAEMIERARSPLWRPIHILTIVAIAVVAAGAGLVAGTLMSPRAAVLGVGFAIAEFVLPGTAEALAAATGDEAGQAVIARADAAMMIIGATSFSFQTLFGLAVAILAIATLLSDEYPRWLCAIGLAGGIV